MTNRWVAVLVAIGLAGPACIGDRRPGSRTSKRSRTGTSSAPLKVVQPDDVDDSLTQLVTGDRMQVLFNESDAIKGAGEPLVTIVEFSDFQCPFCARLASSLNELVGEYGSDVRLVFKHFPLDGHKNAPAAAAAAIAAGEQGKFWEMHDRLFVDSSKLNATEFQRHAKELGLDEAQFKGRLKAPDVKARVKSDTKLGSALGVSQTPTFFVNGTMVLGAKPLESIKAIVAEERRHALALLEAGSKREELYARIMKAAQPVEGAPKPEPKPDAKPKPEPPEKKPAPQEKPAEPEAPKLAVLDAEVAYAVPLGKDRPARGPENALVTIVEFSSLACEACKANREVLAAVAKKHPNVRWVFRHLVGEDAIGRRAAHLAVAAGQQGKFWEVRDALLADKGDLNGQDMISIINKLKIDQTKFRANLQAPETATLIEEDKKIADGFRAGSDGPFYFVNGRALTGEVKLEDFETLIAAETKKAAAWLKKNGKKRSATVYAEMAKTWQATG